MYEHSSVADVAQAPTEPSDVVAQMRNSINSNIQKALAEVDSNPSRLACGVLTERHLEICPAPRLDANGDPEPVHSCGSKGNP
jgi:hypothetical protein